jgi:hypothetical protein
VPRGVFDASNFRFFDNIRQGGGNEGEELEPGKASASAAEDMELKSLWAVEG